MQIGVGAQDSDFGVHTELHWVQKKKFTLVYRKLYFQKELDEFQKDLIRGNFLLPVFDHILWQIGNRVCESH